MVVINLSANPEKCLIKTLEALEEALPEIVAKNLTTYDPCDKLESGDVMIFNSKFVGPRPKNFDLCIRIEAKFSEARKSYLNAANIAISEAIREFIPTGIRYFVCITLPVAAYLTVTK